jgi:hypothetical protein
VRLFLPLLFFAAMLAAQRSKPAYDPETREGFLIEHILQERDPAAKLRYMDEFAAQYPSHPAILWVYDQLQPAYFNARQWDQAIRTGAARLALEPANLDAAKIALTAAVAKHDPAAIAEWSVRVWHLAPKAGTSAEARQTADYAESSLYSAAIAAPDPRAKLELLQTLQREMPSSKYIAGLPVEYFRIYRQMGDDNKALEFAEKGLQSEPSNVDILMFLAEINFHKNDARSRQLVTQYTARALASLDKTERPPQADEAQWNEARAKLQGEANYMAGVSNSLNNNFKAADNMLRAALPYIKNNADQQAALLYHLGMANYRLAEASNDRRRPVDALRYMRLCAAIKSPFQEQARRNVEAIKAEYNLP